MPSPLMHKDASTKIHYHSSGSEFFYIFIKSTGHLNRVTSSVLPRVTDNGSQAKNLPTEKYVKSYTKYLYTLLPQKWVTESFIYIDDLKSKDNKIFLCVSQLGRRTKNQ